MINPSTGNTFRFDWMIATRWAVKEIKSTFRTSPVIARHIQSTARNEQDARAIAEASRMLCNQVGF